MTTDIQSILDFTGREEGLRLQTYKCPAEKDTIGYGHNLTDNGLPDEILKMDGLDWDKEHWRTLSITKDVARRLFEIDARAAQDSLQVIFPDFKIYSENRQIALTDMMFNMGSYKFRGFKNMIAAIKLELWRVAADEAKNSNWYRQVTNRAGRVITLLREG